MPNSISVVLLILSFPSFVLLSQSPSVLSLNDLVSHHTPATNLHYHYIGLSVTSAAPE